MFYMLLECLPKTVQIGLKEHHYIAAYLLRSTPAMHARTHSVHTNLPSLS